MLWPLELSCPRSPDRRFAIYLQNPDYRTRTADLTILDSNHMQRWHDGTVIFIFLSCYWFSFSSDYIFFSSYNFSCHFHSLPILPPFLLFFLQPLLLPYFPSSLLLTLFFFLLLQHRFPLFILIFYSYFSTSCSPFLFLRSWTSFSLLLLFFNFPFSFSLSLFLNFLLSFSLPILQLPLLLSHLLSFSFTL